MNKIDQKPDKVFYWRQYKHFFFLFLPAAVLIAALLIVTYRFEYNSQKDNILMEEADLTDIVAETATDFFSYATKDLLLLSSMEEIKDYFDGNNSKEKLEDLVKEFAVFCELKPFFDRIRIIDLSGKELLNVKRRGGKILSLPEEELQDKSNRYYFTEAIKLSHGEVYFSPMDLNMEHGEIELPWKPVVRIASPVFDNQGTKQGILVLNLLGTKIFNRVRSLMHGKGLRQIILDPDGYWLYGTEVEDSFASMFDEKKDRSFAKLYPNAWRWIADNEAGAFNSSEAREVGRSEEVEVGGEERLYTFMTLYRSGTYFTHMEMAGGLSEGSAVKENASLEPYWKIVTYTPKSGIGAELSRKYLLFYSFLVCLLIIISIFYSRYKLNKEKREERYRLVHKYAFDGILLTNRNGVIVEYNKSIEKTFGYSKEELMGKSLSCLVPDKYLNASDSTILGKMIEVEGLHKSGNRIPIEIILSSFNASGSYYVSATIRDISERKKSEEMIEKLAYYDQLTGMPNRALFLDRLTLALARARRYDKKLGLLFMDFDHFKNLNDTLGHVIGDKFLKVAAERLMDFCRSSDSAARLGGDEFVIFVADQEELSGITIVAGKVAALFKEPFEIDGHEFFLTASIGVSAYPNDGIDVTALMKNSDTAMYKAKAEGGGRFSYYNSSMNDMAIEKLELENKFRRAEARQEFYLDYQPQVDPVTFKIVGVEALLRWRDADKGLISPMDFIPIAESTRLIVPIGKWVLMEACKETVRLQKSGLKGLCIAVNVSLYQLKEKSFIDTLVGVLEETGLDPKYLELEITESVAMDNVEESIRMLKEIKSKGVSLSIDDFGTGYSSLEYLKRMPIDVLKIDRSFIKEITENEEDRKIVETIMNIAHGFNCRVVGEGVETYEQLNILKSLGCDIIQGYYFSKPVAPEEIREFYECEDQLDIQTVNNKA